MDETERTEELLSHYAEGELTEAERDEVEALLAARPELRDELALARAVMDKLAALPCEVAPTDLARRIMEAAPPVPGGFLHQAEITLRRLLAPGLATAAIMAVALLVVGVGGTGPTRAPMSYPPVQVATLVAGAGGVRLGDEQVAAGSRRDVVRGQRLVIPSGSSATLRVGQGVEIQVAEASELLLDPRVVHLERGAVDVSVEPGIGNFVVHGPLASAMVVGTRFRVEVAPNDDTAVRVLEGKVDTKAIHGGKTVRLVAGGQATVRRGAPAELQVEGPTIPTNGRPLQVAAPASPPSGPVAGVEATARPASTPEGLPSLDSN